MVLDKGQQDDWFNSSFIIAFAIISVVSLLLLLYVEMKHAHPVINLRLFRTASFSTGNFIMFMVGFCLYGSVVMLPLFLQTLMGYSATMAGMVMAPGGLATLVTMPFVGAWIRRHDGRKVILAGLLLGAFSMYLMRGFTLEASYWDFMWPRVLLGFALAFIFPPLSTLTLAAIPREQMGNATGMYNLLRNIGGSVGIAMTATFLARFAQSFQTNLVGHVNPFNPLFQTKFSQLKQAAMARGMDAVTAKNAALEVIYLTVRKQAGILTYDYIFWLIGLAFLGTIPFLLLLKRPRFNS